MTLQELQNQALQLPISDRWQLVQTLLESLKRETHPMSQGGNLSRLRGIAKASIEKETLLSISPNSTIQHLTNLDPWTQSLIGSSQLHTDYSTESYVDYLEEKCS